MRWFLVVCTVLLLTASCTSSGDEADEIDPDSIIVDTEPTPETFDASDPEQLAGVSTSPSNIETGDCFNEYVYYDRSDIQQQITTLVGCEGSHDREAYFMTEYPAAVDEPAPADETLKRWASTACLDEFEDFVGLEYVLSLLEIGTIVPTFETWTEQDDRNVICYVYPDEPGRRLRTSVGNSGL